MKIREAIISDAEGIAKVHVDCWRSTYKGIVSDVYLERMSYEKRTQAWVQNIARTDNYVLVAESEEGKIIGFTDGGKRETNQVVDSGDLTSIYILEEFQGKGIGKRLVEKLFTHFKELGYKKVFVEVLEDNKSRFFYEKMGANHSETTTVFIQGEELYLSIYEWENINSVLSQIT
ncbi:GNAT family N-acetyltransferase [Peribacillus alkalitolerans]|uniref:GNAT family N-acetyltransferase n=1 Tax=Peribacillus alkalitolerans TaxID=1550385 RepID=UPI0013D26613|nr:GNAT family N-acetyltransferase [Peribacillus alkalitolerans]